MTFVTNFYLSVDINLSLFSFLSNRYVFIPNDSDKSDKRSHGQSRQGLRVSDKSKMAMTKGAVPHSANNFRDFCHCMFCHFDALNRLRCKAFRLLSLLSLSFGRKG